MWKNSADDVMDINYDVIVFISKTYILRSPRVAIFADMKTLTVFIKNIFQDLKKVKRTENNVWKYNTFISWCSKIYWFPLKKMLMSVELKGCVTWHTFFR